MPKLAVVIPTFNEAQNVPLLVARLHNALQGIDWEAVFVDDDSPDGTARVVVGIALRDPHVRLIHRIGRRGLSSACVEGMLSTSAPILAVMDADLQHDESILPAMLKELESGSLDVVVGTRHASGGSMGEFGARRVWLSNLGKKLAALVCHVELSDPMSGFFCLRAAFLYSVVHQLSQSGFKILVDLLASAKRPVQIGEVPYTFRSRQHGESKLDTNVLASYLYLLADQVVGRWIPLRFFLFCLVGIGGVVLHLGLLFAGLRLGLRFDWAQVLATFASMTGNYVFNNTLTFMDRKRRGLRWLSGLLIWYAACSLGLILNLKVANLLQRHNLSWAVAGIGGLAVAALWNFGITNVMIWRSRVRSAKEQSRRDLEVLSPVA